MTQVSAESVITAVTVYRDRAHVTRTAKVEVDKNTCGISVGGLPAALDEYSLRVKGRGSAPVKIGSIEIKREFRGEPLAEEKKELRDAIIAAVDKKKNLEDGKTLIEDKIKFLKETAIAGHSDLSKTISRKRITVEEGGAIMDFYFGRISELTASLEENRVALRDIDEEINKLNLRWKKMESPGILEGKSVLVRVESMSEGEFFLEASYVIFGAGWESTYDIRYLSGEKKILLEYKAAVVQQTGEDWEGVDLKLSTASPGSGANPPELVPCYVDFFRPVRPPLPRSAPAPSGMRMMKVKEKRKDMDDYMECAVAEDDGEFDLPAPEPAEILSASVESTGGPSVTYTPAGKADIPSDGDPHLVFITGEEFEGKTDYVLVPELAENAYIRTKVVNSSPFVFLAGATNIFRDDEFVGRGEMKLVNPGSEFTCYLGADERLRAKYDVKRYDDDSAGLTGGSRRLNRSVSINIKSDFEEDVPALVRGRCPVPQNRDIKIKSLKYREKPSEEKDNGIVIWEISVKAREERKLTMEYTVEFPREEVIKGI
ncbi:MAG TPA: DUF4139 domain-containing protein [Spirochaetota bacterium]|nr:DUF4139 domain-containing protein [Spirochaetota bacterium]HPJ34854.1 DUF4139 domain-containing protein [Spirochaetota bacterium]